MGATVFQPGDVALIRVISSIQSAGRCVSCPSGGRLAGEAVQKTVEKMVRNRLRDGGAGLRLALRPRQILNYSYKMFYVG